MSCAFPASFLPAARRATAFAFLTAAALLPAAAFGATSTAAGDDDDDEAGTAKTAAIAAAADPARNLSAIQLWAENDLGWGDRYYSSGLKIAYTTPEVWTDGIPLFVRDLIALTPLAQNSVIVPAAYRLHFALNYEFYTPQDEYVKVPRPNDHPYVGMLYGTIGLSSETEFRLDALEVSVGVVGPSARARQAQNGWHRVIGAKIVNGWDTQVRDEPLLQLAWTRVGRYNWVQRGGFGVDWLPRVHVEAGTVRDYAALGAQWRIGWNLPRDFGIGNIRSTSALTRPASGLTKLLPSSILPDSTWLFVDAQGEGWLYNTALDGNIWHKSAKVHRDAFVGEVSVGIATQWGGVRMSIAEVLRTREFRTQEKEFFDYTTVSLSVTF